MDALLKLAIYAPALFALVSPVYLGVRILRRRLHGERGDFALAYWLLSSAAPILLGVGLLVSTLMPVEAPIRLHFGLCILGIALGFVVRWLQPAGWTKGDVCMSIIANLATLWVLSAVVLVAASIGRGH